MIATEVLKRCVLCHGGGSFRLVCAGKSLKYEINLLCILERGFVLSVDGFNASNEQQHRDISNLTLWFYVFGFYS